jgi:hypothetical protein
MSATAGRNTTVVGTFDDVDRANRAMSALLENGFLKEHVGMVYKADRGPSRKEVGDTEGATYRDEKPQEVNEGQGAFTGALAGLGIGAAAGLAVLSGAIPVVGPAIAAGTLGVLLTNAAAGAGLGGLVGALVGKGVAEWDARFFEGEFEAGRVIMTIDAPGRVDQALSLLRAHGARDVRTSGEDQQSPDARSHEGIPSGSDTDATGGSPASIR